MPTTSEADLIRRNLHLQQQVDAARAELSREATAAGLLQQEVRSLQVRLAVYRKAIEQMLVCTEMGTIVDVRAVAEGVGAVLKTPPIDDVYVVWLDVAPTPSPARA